MNPFLEKMMAQVYELEGLLLVIEHHKEETSDFVYDMVRRKVERINELAPMCTPEIFGGKKAEEAPEAVVIPEEYKEEDPEVEEVVAETAVEEDEAEPVVEEVAPVAFEAPEEMDEQPFEEVEIAQTETEEAEIETPVAAEEVEEVLEQDEAVEAESEAEEIIDEPEVEDLVEPEEDDDDDFFIEEEDDDDQEIVTLDEALQRSLSKNLWKAFSLNDHFRYRRELFSNSDVEMRNTINMVEAMESFAEAEEYFYNDLEWDAESPEVKDFMEIIKKHFL